MDLKLVETLNGGDLVKKPKDLSVIRGLQNMPYLALFGGNVEASTPTKRIESQQAFDWWGNSLLMPQDQSTQFNSQTERVLHSVALNSAGRLLVEQAVIKDLQFMRPFANIAVRTAIVALDTIAIGILIQEPDNLQAKEFIYIWDATKQELTDIADEGGGYTPERKRVFDFTFDYTFN